MSTCCVVVMSGVVTAVVAVNAGAVIDAVATTVAAVTVPVVVMPLFCASMGPVTSVAELAMTTCVSLIVITLSTVAPDNTRLPLL